MMVEEDKTIEMSALGRPFGLGMLYDYRCDQLIPAITLWDPDVLKTNCNVTPQPYTNYSIQTENSLNDKVNLLGVEGSIKLSILTGLVDVSGSAKYMNDCKTTKQVERVTLKYSTTLRFEQLSMTHLDKKKIIHTEILDQDIATHVVIGIVYGADAFFVFNRETSHSEDSTVVHGKMEVLLNKIPQIGMSAGVELTMNDDEKKTAESLKCTFYGDFNLKENPSTFEQALKVYKDLPNMLGQSGERAVAKIVYLYPLRLLNRPDMKIIREVSNDLVDKCVSLIDDLRELQIQANDLVNDGYSAVYRNKEHLLIFAKYIEEFEGNSKQKMMELLPKIRGNVLPQSQLSDFIKESGSSPFRRQALFDWLNTKRREITMEENFIRLIKKEIAVDSSPNALDNALSDIECDYIFCLSVHLAEKNNSYLEVLRRYLDDKTIDKNGEGIGSSWVDNREITGSSREKAKFFFRLVQSNSNNRKLKFVVDDQYIDKEKQRIGILVNVYQNGIEQNIELPSKFDKPFATEINEDNILLTWAKPEHGANSVQQYKLMYKQETEKEWKSFTGNFNETKSQSIKNLHPNTTYRFQVQAITAIGIIVESDMSDPIVTKPLVTPNIPANARWIENAVTVAGGHGKGDAMNQLSAPWGIFLDDDLTIIVSDYDNQRIVEWKRGDPYGRVVAGGHGRGKRLDQLAYPSAVLIDKETDHLIIADRDNRRVVQWSRGSDTSQGEILLNNIRCYGLAMDTQRNIYVSDTDDHEVRRYRLGDKNGVVVAGGHGRGNNLNQLNYPCYIYVDQQQNVYISEDENHRVVKWNKGAKEGIVVAGGQGQGSALTQLSHPRGLFVDTSGNVYVADSGNHRIMRWCKGEKQGTVIAGGHGEGDEENQLARPMGIFFDFRNHIYVVDWDNHRVQCFSTEKTT